MFFYVVQEIISESVPLPPVEEQREKILSLDNLKRAPRKGTEKPRPSTKKSIKNTESEFVF